jgi:hypothetical protein
MKQDVLVIISYSLVYYDDTTENITIITPTGEILLSYQFDYDARGGIIDNYKLDIPDTYDPQQDDIYQILLKFGFQGDPVTTPLERANEIFFPKLCSKHEKYNVLKVILV